MRVGLTMRAKFGKSQNHISRIKLRMHNFVAHSAPDFGEVYAKMPFSLEIGLLRISK